MTSKLDPRTPEPKRQPAPEREARRHPRVELPARCWMSCGDHTVYLRIHDVSRGGLSVRAPVPFPPHGPLELRLELPGGSILRARAEVVWVRDVEAQADASGPRMGARFLEFLEGEEALYNLLGNA